MLSLSFNLLLPIILKVIIRNNYKPDAMLRQYFRSTLIVNFSLFTTRNPTYRLLFIKQSY